MDTADATDGERSEILMVMPGAPRRRFASGALESASHILGSTSAGVFVAGLVGPYVAAMSEPKGMTPPIVMTIAALALVFSVTAGVGAVILRGLGHSLAHQASHAQPAGGRS